MHVLLVEDDDSIAEPLVTGLTRDGFDVTGSPPAAAALAAPVPEFVLLDLGLPDRDGSDVCRELRRRSDVPIIVVTARADEVDRVVVLELGADDYMVKPFGFRELVARIRAVARRVAATGRRPAAIRVGRPRDRPAHADGSTSATRELALTPKEFDLLALLASDAGAVHRRDEILEQVWDAHWYGPTKTLDVHVASLRKKLGDPRWIETVRGVGFRLGSADAGMTRRLLLSYLSITAFVLLILEIPLALTYEHRERDRLAADVERDARVARDARRGHAGGRTQADMQQLADEYQQTVGGGSSSSNPDGRSVADSGAPTPRDFSTRPELAEALRDRRGRLAGPGTRTRSTRRCCTSPCRSRRRARCSARCGSRSRPASSTRCAPRTGSRSPRWAASCSWRSPASASCSRARSPDRCANSNRSRDRLAAGDLTAPASVDTDLRRCARSPTASTTWPRASASSSTRSARSSPTRRTSCARR